MTDLLQTAPMRFGVVLLAAGEGARMGGVPKCLIRLDDQPLLRRSLQAMLMAGADRVVLVTGYYAEAIEALAEALVNAAQVQLVRNPEPARGQGSSVRAGLEALHSAGSPNCDAVIIALADQPLVGAPEISALLDGFRDRPAGTDVVYPVVRGQRGNPVVLSGALAAQLIASGRAGAVRKFIDEHPAQVHILVSDNDAFITDLDTREDIAALAVRCGCSVSLPGEAAA